MNPLFVFLIIISFLITLLGDFKHLKKEKTRGKVVYGVLTSLVLVLLVAGLFDLPVMVPTHWIIYQIAPYIQEMVIKQ
jgi:hypothetical protein